MSDSEDIIERFKKERGLEPLIREGHLREAPAHPVIRHGRNFLGLLFSRAKRKEIVMGWLEALVDALFRKSWKTTCLGIAILLLALGAFGKALFDGDPQTVPQLEQVIAALAGLGLLGAKDANKTHSKD